jgi:hypothetical protein
VVSGDFKTSSLLIQALTGAALMLLLWIGAKAAAELAVAATATRVASFMVKSYKVKITIRKSRNAKSASLHTDVTKRYFKDLTSSRNVAQGLQHDVK